MSDKLKKFLDTTVKSVEGEPGTFWFTASTDARDRQGDVIVQNTWKVADFMKNPVILWAHNYYETPIGKAIEIKMGPDSLSVKIQFVPESTDPFAGKVAKLVEQGFLKTVSVGFMVYKSEPLTVEDLAQRPEMKYGQRLHGDLLEVSIVPVPANPEALNQNEYGEVIARGLDLKPNEAKSKFLPYTDAKGNVSPRLLRASYAAAHGARGGVKITDVEPMAAVNHLCRIARENKIELPKVTEMIGKGMDRRDMKDLFSDVWHEELLDVLNVEGEGDDVLLKLVKGKTRSEFIRARDALTTLIELTEEPPVPADPVAETKTAEQLTSIIKALSDVTARLS
jgi:HK97 family phage prohead protease